MLPTSIFFLVLSILPILVSSLKLQAPLNPVSGQSTLFTWTTEPGDPEFVTIALANPSRYGINGHFTLGSNVLLSAGSRFFVLLSSQVPATNGYTVLALDSITGSTIATSDTFSVFTQSKNGLNLPLNIRIAIGVAIAVLILLVIIGGLWQRRRRQQQAAASMQQLPPPVTSMGAQQPSYYASQQPNPPYAGGGYNQGPYGGTQYPAQTYYNNGR